MNKPRWQELCAQAAVEQDSEKLLRLVTEINQLLDNTKARKFLGAALMPANSFQESSKLQGGE